MRTPTTPPAPRRSAFVCDPAPARRLAGLLASVAIAVAAPVRASGPPEAPGLAAWTPDVIAAIDEYVRTPSFNDGMFFVDHFAAPTSADEVGLVTAQLADGDFVVAGLVPRFGETGTCSDGTALCNVGLVRYTRWGRRVAWPDPGGSGFFGGQYLVYPNTTNGGFQYLRDVKVVDGMIHVLLDLPNTNQSGLGRQNVVIASFFDSGRPRGSIQAFGGGSADAEDFYGAQMVRMSNDRLIVTATDYDGTSSYLAASRLRISASGGLDQDPDWGSAYGDSGNRIVRYPSNVAYTVGYAVNQVGFASQDDFYVAGSFDDQGDSDVLVQKISSVTGAYKPEFGGSGFAIVDFAYPGGTHDDVAGGLYVFQDDVYVAARVAKDCSLAFGTGIAKLDGASGAPAGGFGTSGRIVFGGTGSPCGVYAQATVPLAISATGGRIGVAGYVRASVTGQPDVVDPLFAAVDAASGTVLDWSRRPVTNPDGTTYGAGVLYGIFGGPSPGSPFTVAGNVRDAAHGNTLSFLAGMFSPTSDLIFFDGFQ